MNTVQLSWAKPITNDNARPLERLNTKLHNLMRHLQAWSQWNIGNIHAQHEQATELLHRLEVARGMRGISAT